MHIVEKNGKRLVVDDSNLKKYKDLGWTEVEREGVTQGDENDNND